MKLNDLFERVVVINLDRREDRLIEFDKQAKEINLVYERHSAFDAQEHSVAGHTACLKSHTEIMKKAIIDKVESIFILEDDAEFVQDFDKKLEEVWGQVPKDWDIFYGGLWLLQYRKYSNLLVRPTNSYSSHAYGMNSKSLKYVYENMQEKTHIDLALSVLNQDLNAYCPKPALVYQRPGYSDITKNHRDVRNKYV